MFIFIIYFYIEAYWYQRILEVYVLLPRTIDEKFKDHIFNLSQHVRNIFVADSSDLVCLYKMFPKP